MIHIFKYIMIPLRLHDVIIVIHDSWYIHMEPNIPDVNSEADYFPAELYVRQHKHVVTYSDVRKKNPNVFQPTQSILTSIAISIPFFLFFAFEFYFMLNLICPQCWQVSWIYIGTSEFVPAAMIQTSPPHNENNYSPNQLFSLFQHRSCKCRHILACFFLLPL